MRGEGRGGKGQHAIPLIISTAVAFFRTAADAFLPYPLCLDASQIGVRMLQDGEADGDPDEFHGEDREQGDAAAAPPSPNPDENPCKVAGEETCGAGEGIESLASSMSTLPSSLSSFSSLGNDEGEGCVSADRVVAKPPLDVKCVAAGQSFTVVCTADGGVFACGVGGGGGDKEGDAMVLHKGGERLSRITSLSTYFITSVACGVSAGALARYTLRPAHILRALHPAPCTSHPAPCTLHLAPGTLHIAP